MTAAPPPSQGSSTPSARSVLRSRAGGRAPAGSPPRLPGLHRLSSSAGRDGLLLLPACPDPERPTPLLIMLHGAGGSGEQALPMVREAAERRGVAVLAPDSRERHSWDLIAGGHYGPDVAFIDRSLAALFAQVAIDPDRIAIGGFSDGASYALSLGLTNGALARAVLAFSPGFAAPTQTRDHPAIFISHGTDDRVLPIDPCGRRIARVLEEAGYRVDYREFEGGHEVPPDLVEAAFAFFLDEETAP